VLDISLAGRPTVMLVPIQLLNGNFIGSLEVESKYGTA
jgi:hypothetical protein